MFPIFLSKSADLSFDNANLTKMLFFYCDRALLSATFSTFLSAFSTFLTHNTYVFVFFPSKTGEKYRKYQKNLKIPLYYRSKQSKKWPVICHDFPFFWRFFFFDWFILDLGVKIGTKIQLNFCKKLAYILPHFGNKHPWTFWSLYYRPKFHSFWSKIH